MRKTRENEVISTKSYMKAHHIQKSKRSNRESQRPLMIIKAEYNKQDT
jgi:hypothetical protein